MKRSETVKKPEKKLSVAAALASLVAAPILAASPAAADINADTIDKSIVWVDSAWSASVQVPFKDGTTETFRTTVYAYCTGWFVSDTGHVATAGHCVEADDAIRTSVYANVIDEQDLTGVKAENVDWPMTLGDPSIKIDQPSGIEGGVLSGKTAITAQLIAKQGFEKGDNALLRIADMKDTPALSIGSEAPKVREKVTSIGFPDLVGSTSDVERQKPSYRSGAVSSRSYSTQGVPRTEIDTDITPGMSGGPSVNEDGQVIGINSAYVYQGAGQANYITDTQTLRDFLTANGVKLVESAPQSAAPAAAIENPTAVTSSGPEIPLWMIVTLIGLVLALAVMAVFLTRAMRKQPRPASAAAVPAGTQLPWVQEPHRPEDGPRREDGQPL
ncbi:serine protease [Paenarthrobacter sp.]|uniref:serine protease n=1 Tax=Paenarthrobacter sp. TaxID=1931993 RepID=UPI002812854A|nr:serine protease [Paenarthrobacter sp.]